MSLSTSASATGPDGQTIRYVDTGPIPGGSPVVVLLHSLGADHRMWREQVAALRTNHRVIVPDCRGHGDSPGTGHASVGEWVDDLESVLRNARVDRAAVVGVSLGGIQAIAYAAARPERIASLVVADSFVELDPAVAKAKVQKQSRAAEAHGMTAVAQAYLDETFMPSPDRPAGAQDVGAALAGMAVSDYVAAVRACFEVRIADRLADVAAPTLVLWGDRDGKTPRHLSERICTGISGAQLVEVPAAGHLSNVDNPAAFTVLTADFVSRPDSRLLDPDTNGAR